MADNPKFIAARTRLNALGEVLPSFPSEKNVAEYHSILKDIEANSTYDLSPFLIPEDQVTRQAVGWRRRSYSGRPGGAIYSAERRCDYDYFKRQVQGAREFLNEMSKASQPASASSHDYWAKTDDELLALADAYGMSTSYRPFLAGPGRSVALDRDKLIEKLLQRDRAVMSHHPGNVTMNFNAPVTGSAIQAGSPYATASATSSIDLTALADIISKLKAEKSNLPLSESASEQFDLNIRTLEREAERATPDHSIILRCLNNAMSTLIAVGEGVVSNVAYAALVKFFS